MTIRNKNFIALIILLIIVVASYFVSQVKVKKQDTWIAPKLN